MANGNGRWPKGGRDMVDGTRQIGVNNHNGRLRTVLNAFL